MTWRGIAITGVVVASIYCVPANQAIAAWSAGGSGTAAGAAATMPNGNTPTASANVTAVTVAWNAATLTGGTPVSGYVIQRYNAVNGAPAIVGGTCAGVVTATSCSETVAAGTWVYTDTPVEANWTGGASSPSNPVTVGP